MDNYGSTYWIKLSKEYAEKHPAIVEVSNINKDTQGNYSYIAKFKINLPGKFDLNGITDTGIRSIEPVEFIFDKNFPYKAPLIYLRDDFNRNFPHINPSLKKINPCIFEGNLNDLIQQPMWFDLLLNQLSDWFEKAAAQSLMNYEQGWEPIRTDDFNGHIWFSKQKMLENINQAPLIHNVRYSVQDNNFIFGDYGVEQKIGRIGRTVITYAFCFFSEKVNDKYHSNYIETFGDLIKFVNESNIQNFKTFIDKHLSKLIEKNIEYFAIILGIKRPVNLILSDSDIEIINFAVKIKAQKKQKKTKKLHMKSEVFHLSHKEICSSELLQQYSGISINGNKKIIQLGCGSVGSKITMSLGRNGNNNFDLVDHNRFSPHNNARHACIGNNFASLYSKAGILKLYLNYMNISAEAFSCDIIDKPEVLEKGAIIIDSTASISVRNFIATYPNRKPSMVHTALYNEGQLAVMSIEGNNKNPRIDDLFCALYSYCLEDTVFKNKFVSEQLVRLSIGQGCGSFTTVASDSRISLSISGMISRIQSLISKGFSDNGEINIGNIDSSEMNVNWKKIEIGKTYVINRKSNDDWEIRILPKAYNMINEKSKNHTKKETGGGLIGHISIVNQIITVTDLLPPPIDSVMKENLFIQGIEGLKSSIININEQSNGLLTYLGTWHSHPQGGCASQIDELTKQRMIILRDYNPTVCLIWTPKSIIRI